MTEESVSLDPSVLDWRPVCEDCKRPIESWADAIGLPGALIEDDEPTFMLFAHKVCPTAMGEALTEPDNRVGSDGGGTSIRKPLASVRTDQESGSVSASDKDVALIRDGLPRMAGDEFRYTTDPLRIRWAHEALSRLAARQARMEELRAALGDPGLLTWLGSCDVLDVSAEIARAVHAIHNLRAALSPGSEERK